MSDAIQFNVDAALAKLEALVQAHGTRAIDVAAQVERVNAINSLTGIPGWGAVAIGFVVVGRWFWRRAGDDCEGSPLDSTWCIGTGCCYVLAALTMIPFLSSLLDVWSWIALFNPKLALAHDVLAKFAGL